MLIRRPLERGLLRTPLEPTAKLGILLIPMGPVSGYLGDDPDRVIQNVQEATESYNLQFGDYLLMYRALAGDVDQAIETAKGLDDVAIDDGDSRSYLLAWLYSRR